MNNVREIIGTITLEDGSVSEFSITAGLGWQQWGATRSRLFETSETVETLSNGLLAGECMMPSEA